MIFYTHTEFMVLYLSGESFELVGGLSFLGICCIPTSVRARGTVCRFAADLRARERGRENTLERANDVPKA